MMFAPLKSSFMNCAAFHVLDLQVPKTFYYISSAMTVQYHTRYFCPVYCILFYTSEEYHSFVQGAVAHLLTLLAYNHTLSHLKLK